MRNLTTVVIGSLALAGCTGQEVSFEEQRPIKTEPEKPKTTKPTLEQATLALGSNDPVLEADYYLHQDDRPTLDHAASYYGGFMTSEKAPAYATFHRSKAYRKALSTVLPKVDNNGDKIISRAEARRYKEIIYDLEELFVSTGKLQLVFAQDIKKAREILHVQEDELAFHPGGYVSPQIYEYLLYLGAAIHIGSVDINDVRTKGINGVQLPKLSLGQRKEYALFLQSVDTQRDKIITWEEAIAYEQKLKKRLEKNSS